MKRRWSNYSILATDQFEQARMFYRAAGAFTSASVPFSRPDRCVTRATGHYIMTSGCLIKHLVKYEKTDRPTGRPAFARGPAAAMLYASGVCTGDGFAEPRCGHCAKK